MKSPYPAQSCGHIFNLDDLIRYERDTAHDEQHRYASVSARNNNTLTKYRKQFGKYRKSIYLCNVKGETE